MKYVEIEMRLILQRLQSVWRLVIAEELSLFHRFHDRGHFPGNDCFASNPVDLLRPGTAVFRRNFFNSSIL